MTKEDIIRMAREAGFEEITTDEWAGYTNSLETFFQLIAEAEREACAGFEKELALSPAFFATVHEYDAHLCCNACRPRHLRSK